MNATPAPDGDIAAGFQDWIGRTLLIDDEIALQTVRRIAAMVDQDPAGLQRGDPLPPHWYSMFFTLNARQSQIGHDGHPRKGEFLPPIPLPRRMFVGRETEFLAPLRIGDEAVKRSEIESIVQKTGRSGPLVFLDVRHTIEARGRVALVERQHVVYREAAPAVQAAQPASVVQAIPGTSAASAVPASQVRAADGAGAPAGPDWQESLVIDPVLVFRYSAVTWNGHRIHYDADYARGEEGYPGCVMNGALTVHLLVDAALRRAPGSRLASLQARLSRPMFVGDAMSLCGEAAREEDGGRTMKAWACDAGGRLAAELTLGLEEGQWT